MSRATPPLNVLIVEDEALLAMDIEAIVEDTGHRVVAEAASLHDVEKLDDALSPDLAFVDIQLAEGTNGLDVSKLIQARWGKTVIVFVTANPKKIPEDYAGAHGVIAKPFSRSGMMSALLYITEGVCSPPPTSPKPASFIPAPTLKRTWGQD